MNIYRGLGYLYIANERCFYCLISWKYSWFLVTVTLNNLSISSGPTEELTEVSEKQHPYILFNLNAVLQILCRMVLAFPIFSLPGLASVYVLV